jgi:hypothetical protein
VIPLFAKPSLESVATSDSKIWQQVSRSMIENWVGKPILLTKEHLSPVLKDIAALRLELMDSCNQITRSVARLCYYEAFIYPGNLLMS